MRIQRLASYKGFDVTQARCRKTGPWLNPTRCPINYSALPSLDMRVGATIRIQQHAMSLAVTFKMRHSVRRLPSISLQTAVIELQAQVEVEAEIEAEAEIELDEE